MENINDTIKLEYNTEREPLAMPEYGRGILKMVERLKKIPDRDKRSEQAAAVVKAMELLNPQVRQTEDFRHKLWDHLFIISGFDLDIDSPFPRPVPEVFETKPLQLPMKDSRIKANHYGRNIEKIINLLCEEPDGEVKSAMIHALATYMRQQYLIWNKDSVADETIFADIEKLSDYRIRIPEGMTLGKVAENGNFNRPGQNQQGGKNNQRRQFKKRKKQ